MKPTNLKHMYGSTPDRFKQSLSAALQKTEEKPMKHTLRTILVTALVLLALTAAAYAAFSSKVIQQFSNMYGKPMQTWLEQGDVATVSQSIILQDSIVFTLDEVVYRDNALYGVGTIQPLKNSAAVVIAADHTPDEPFGYDIYGEGGKAEKPPANAKTIAETVAQKQGKLFVVRALPDLIGVDGGEMLSPGCIGYALVPQRDGSVLFTFEVSDAFVVQQGAQYSVQMWACATQMQPDGALLADTRQTGTWLVEFEPSPILEKQPAPAPGNTIAGPPISYPNPPALIVPDAYTQNGTLPVYHATAQDFTKDLNPLLLNQSGIADRQDRDIVFQNEAILSWTPETLFYKEYSETYNSNYRHPEQTPSYSPLPTLSHAAADLAGNVYSKWPIPWEGIEAQETQLHGITLADAKKLVETCLAQLQVYGYTCDWILDMDTARIQSMGAQMNAMIDENAWNAPQPDYTQVTLDNEGFYLHYGKDVWTDGNHFSIQAYVTSQGIVDLEIRDAYIQGAIYSTPQSLVTPESILEKLPEEVALSRFPSTVLSIDSIQLTYTPKRAINKADGIVLSPIWLVYYQDDSAAKQEYLCWAAFDAIDGTLLSAIFK